jgi:hypothetical protein
MFYINMLKPKRSLKMIFLNITCQNTYFDNILMILLAMSSPLLNKTRKKNEQVISNNGIAFKRGLVLIFIYVLILTAVYSNAQTILIASDDFTATDNTLLNARALTNNKSWSASSLLSTKDNMATVSSNPLGSVYAVTPFSTSELSSDLAVVELDINPNGSEWTAFGFSNASGNISDNGRGWIFIKDNGQYTIFANATINALASGTFPDFTSNTLHACRLVYNRSTQELSAFIDGECILAKEDVSAYYASSAINYAGFQSYKPITAATYVDNFKILDDPTAEDDAYVYPWPRPMSSYPLGTIIEKPFEDMVVDITDDFNITGESWTPEMMDDYMQKMGDIGVTRINWIVSSNLEWGTVGKDFMEQHFKNAVASCHKAGIEIYAIFKPFEGASANHVPPIVTIPAEYPQLDHIGGKLITVSSYVANNPDYRIARAPEDYSTAIVSSIKLIKQNDTPTRISVSDLEIWVGSENGDFSQYTGNITFSNDIEQRNGNNVRVLTLSNLTHTSADKYFMIRCTLTSGTSDFHNYTKDMIELYDSQNKLIPSTADEGIISRDTLINTMTTWWYLRTGLKIIPQAYSIPQSYGMTFNKTAYYLGLGHINLYRKLDDNQNPEDGFIVVAKGRRQYLNGALHPIYPSVRAHWCDTIEWILDAGADGIDIRTGSHSSFAYKGVDFGFNQPVVDKYYSLYGVNILTEEFDLDQWKQIQGEEYTKFIEEAKNLIINKQNPKPLQLHISMQMRDGGMPGWNKNDVPANFIYEWQDWITDDLCSSIMLQYIPFPFESVGTGPANTFGREVTECAQSNNKIISCHVRSIPSFSYWDMNINTAELAIERNRWAWETPLIDRISQYQSSGLIKLETRDMDALGKDSFNIAINGTALNNIILGKSGKEWNSNTSLIAYNNKATVNDNVAGSVISKVAFSITDTSSSISTIQVDINPFGSDWTAVGFSDGGSSLTTYGRGWVLIRDNGTYEVYANGTSNRLALGTLTGFTTNTLHTCKLVYNEITESLSVSIDDIIVLNNSYVGSYYSPLDIDNVVLHCYSPNAYETYFDNFMIIDGVDKEDYINMDDFETVDGSSVNKRLTTAPSTKTWFSGLFIVSNNKATVDSDQAGSAYAKVSFTTNEISSPLVEVQADINPFGSDWTAVGFSDGGSSLTTYGRGWVLIRDNGTYEVYANGISNRLALGTLTGFTTNTLHTCRVLYNKDNETLSVIIDNKRVLDREDVSSYYSSVDIDGAGIHSYRPDAYETYFDNFRVVDARNWEITVAGLFIDFQYHFYNNIYDGWNPL